MQRPPHSRPDVNPTYSHRRSWIAPMLLTAIATVMPGPALSQVPAPISPTPADPATARVIVELRVGAGDDREAAIAVAQDQVIARLVGTRAVVVRRYRSVPQ